MTSNDSDATARNPVWVITAALIVICFLIFGQTVRFGFINLDDNRYVYENPIVLSGLHIDSLQWALTAFHSANWHPLTWISHMADVEFFGTSVFPVDQSTRAGFSATGSLSRKDFGIEFNMALGGDKVMISDKVALELDVQLVAASA